jgi:Type III restriction enzyme, res subunit/Helicase conserved C-terminal domain
MTVSPMLAFPALTGAITHINGGLALGTRPAIMGALARLSTPAVSAEIEILPNASVVTHLAERFTSGEAGRSQIELGEVRTLVGLIEHGISLYTEQNGPKALSGETDAARAIRGSGLLGSASAFTSQIRWDPRDYQSDIARRAARHFSTSKRGIHRLDTGEGKTPLFGFILRQLRKKEEETFGKMPIVMGSHQRETATDLAETMASMFPEERVVLLGGQTTPEDLKDAGFVVGTYSQLAQETTSSKLKEWVGSRAALFVIDEADMVVYNGHREDGERSPSWVRLLVDFGIFRIGAKKFRYNEGTKHYMLGASATLDRPDGIPLSTIWGPGNCYYHTPMAEGVRRGTLVPVVGYVKQMDVPPDKVHLFRDFTSVTSDGKIVVDKAKVMSAVQSDFAVKASVRAFLEHATMKTGQARKGRDVRRGIGYVIDKAALEKHIRKQRDLFRLVEIVYQVAEGLKREKPFTVADVKRCIRELFEMDDETAALERLGVELESFLYSSEWQKAKPLYEAALSSLKNSRKEGVEELFAYLSSVLNVEVRAIRGRALVATGVWQDMDYDVQGHKVREGSPPERYLNQFGNRDETFAAFKRGEIDMVWSIGMLGRGFNYRMASLIIDNSPSSSRREVVQRAGRIMRPPNPLKPTDHGAKPEAAYVTVTPNLEAHKLDLSRYDLARLFGKEVDMDTNFIRIDTREGGDTPWKTPDTAQFDKSGDRRVHLILVGANTRKAIVDFLTKRNKDLYGTAQLDPEVLAFDAGEPTDVIANLLMGIEFPRKEGTLRRYLKMWGADADTTRRIIDTYNSDRAAMRTVYGNAWVEVSR